MARDNSMLKSSVSLTRTADTNAYLANDVVGAATGSTAALTFSNIAAEAGCILIVASRLQIQSTALISGEEAGYDLHLYTVTPPSALGDNTAWDLPSGDRASYAGKVSLGIPADLGSTLWIRQTGLLIPVKTASAHLYAYLVTIGAHTPASSRVYGVDLFAVMY